MNFRVPQKYFWVSFFVLLSLAVSANMRNDESMADLFNPAFAIGYFTVLALGAYLLAAFAAWLKKP
jgi:hypothetical protein